MSKLSFKKQPSPTGLSRIGASTYIDIKKDGKTVGLIRNNGRSSSKDWTISFVVLKADINEDNNPNCEWKWIQLKGRPESEKEAREFVKAKWAIIEEKYPLYSID